MRARANTNMQSCEKRFERRRRNREILKSAREKNKVEMEKKAKKKQKVDVEQKVLHAQGNVFHVCVCERERERVCVCDFNMQFV